MKSLQNNKSEDYYCSNYKKNRNNKKCKGKHMNVKSNQENSKVGSSLNNLKKQIEYFDYIPNFKLIIRIIFEKVFRSILNNCISLIT